MHLSLAVFFLTFAPTALTHGIITTPPSRRTGSTFTSLCGSSINNAVVQDNTSYVEQLTKLSTTDKGYNASACNLWLCKGLQYADNAANVQTWKAGEVVPVKIWLRIPHEGIANVSVVETKSNKAVGSYLKVWEKGYAPGRSEKDVPLEQREFSITVPEGLESTCTKAGDCVSVSSQIQSSERTDSLIRSYNGGGWELRLNRHMNPVLTSRLLDRLPPKRFSRLEFDKAERVSGSMEFRI